MQLERSKIREYGGACLPATPEDTGNLTLLPTPHSHPHPPQDSEVKRVASKMVFQKEKDIMGEEKKNKERPDFMINSHALLLT